MARCAERRRGRPGEAGRHLLLTALRADLWQADRLHTGGEEPQENGSGRFVLLFGVSAISLESFKLRLLTREV